MATQIFVNLSVKNLNRSVEFFTKLGFKFNPEFADETATCMIVSEDIFVMLLTMRPSSRRLLPKKSVRQRKARKCLCAYLLRAEKSR